MRVLTRRAHGRAELALKLRQRGFSSEEIEQAIERALELGLTESDEAIADRYAAELARKSGATPRWVKAKMAERRFPPAAIVASVDRAFAQWDARRAALDYAGTDQNIPRVARRLERRGFPADVIGWTVRRLQSDPEES